MEKKKVAKKTSLASQIIMAIWVAGWATYKFIVNPTTITINDIVVSGVGIAASFSPVYFSIFLDKVREIKFNKSEENQL